MDPFKKKDPQVEADELQDIIRDTLNKKKKPVKFTWKGLADLSTSLFSTNPFDKLKIERLKQLTGGAKEKEKDYIDIVKAIKEEYSEINGLVNNAGILGEKKSIEQFDYKTWTEVQRVNLDAGFLLSKHLLPLMKKSKNSSIIFTSSGVGRIGKAYWGAYSVSKFATEGLMQILSEELQNTSSVRVNCINPGAVRTKMRESAYPAEDPESNPLASEIMTPYLFLMSDISEDITGHSIDAQEN